MQEVQVGRPIVPLINVRTLLTVASRIKQSVEHFQLAMT